MKIIRNGKEIELTAAELEQAFAEKEKDYRSEDAKSKIKEMVNDGEIYIDEQVFNGDEPNDDIVGLIVERFDSIISKSDPYWECFWDAMERAIKDVLTEKE